MCIIEQLDEKGFIFMGPNFEHYLVRIWNGQPWMFYWYATNHWWHLENHWIALRTVIKSEIPKFPRNLTQEEQDSIHDLQKKYECSICQT